MHFTKKKFLSLTERARHKKAGECLKAYLYGKKEESLCYWNLESWLGLPHLDLNSVEACSERWHLHLELAQLAQREGSLLQIKHSDKVSQEPFLPISILLCSLRSAFNVGSILRTNEAFRLGSLAFLGTTPTPDNPKVQKASMGTHVSSPFTLHPDISALPRPWIALETATPSTSLYSFTFPPSFTLLLGNEEFGVPSHLLSEADAIIEIPLLGNKNSLNVASAFAICASFIRLQK